MKQILTVGIAIVAGMALSQSALAKNDGKEARGHAAAPKAAHVAVRGGHSSGHGGHSFAKAPHSFTRGGGPARGGGAIAGNGAGRNFGAPGRPSVAPARNFQSPAPLATAANGRSPVVGRAGTPPATALRGQNQRPAPSVAYGGQSNYGAGRTNNHGFMPPVTVSRGWDHGRQYSWNNHQYGWRNNEWVIIDGGYGYGYPYGYGSPAPIYPSGYSMPNSYGLRESVQQALDQDGYQAGAPDGVIGQQTRNAIAAFQADHGLNPTGQINPPLLNALGIQ